MEFLSNFVPFVLCSNLFSRLFEIGEKLLKNPLPFFAVYKKGWKSNFLERNTNFFVNDARFARKQLWTYSKLIGTPGMNFTFVFNPNSHQNGEKRECDFGVNYQLREPGVDLYLRPCNVSWGSFMLDWVMESLVALFSTRPWSCHQRSNNFSDSYLNPPKSPKIGKKKISNRVQKHNL